MCVRFLHDRYAAVRETGNSCFPANPLRSEYLAFRPKSILLLLRIFQCLDPVLFCILILHCIKRLTPLATRLVLCDAAVFPSKGGPLTSIPTTDCHSNGRTHTTQALY